MAEENLDEDVLYVLERLLEEVEEENERIHTCDDCSIVDSSVKQQTRHRRGRTATTTTTTDSTTISYLCDRCAEKRHKDAQKVLEDLESLAHEVEQRLQAIENTEKQLDQWRDAQLQKNRDFWDEYRRQVENFSTCRIRTLQYEYTMRQLKTQRVMKRLKRAKYIGEHFEQLRDQLIDLFQPSFVDLISSENFQNQFALFLSANDENFTSDQRKEFLEQIEHLSCLDQILIPGDQFGIDDEIKDDTEP